MNRREFLKNSATASLILATPAVAQTSGPVRPQPPPEPPPPVAGITPPVLQAVSEEGATVFWTTSEPATGWVEYGETPRLGLVARGERNGLLAHDDRVLRVRLTGLKPGRTYHYRVQTVAARFLMPHRPTRGTEQQTSPLYRFKTLDSRAPEANFIVWNDTHQRSETLAKLIEQLPRYPADFLFWNGDIFNFIHTEDVLIGEPLHPAGLEYAATRPLMIGRGNHEGRGRFARSLDRVLEPPAGHYYHHFRQGPAEFLVLDTGEDKPDPHPAYAGLTDFAGYRSEQTPWLESVIARPAFREAPFRILFTHIPLRGRGESADSRQKWEEPLRRGKIDLAISGHTHRHAHHEPTAEQPWPLLVGGGPALPIATFIHGHVTAERIRYRLFSAEGSPLGEWTVARAG